MYKVLVAVPGPRQKYGAQFFPVGIHRQSISIIENPRFGLQEQLPFFYAIRRHSSRPVRRCWYLLRPRPYQTGRIYAKTGFVIVVDVAGVLDFFTGTTQPG